MIWSVTRQITLHSALCSAERSLQLQLQLHDTESRVMGDKIKFGEPFDAFYGLIDALLMHY